MQLHALIRNLQEIAKESGHEHPLLIGIDQENGARLVLYHSNIVIHRYQGMVSAFSGAKVGVQ